MTIIPPNKELADAVERALAWLDSLSPEEREEHFRIQRENYAKSGPFGPTDGMGTRYHA